MITGFSLAGCLLFIFAGSISEWYFKQNITTHKLAEFYALVLGIFGFVIMQSSLMTSSDILTEVLMDSHKSEGFFELWVFRWKSMGRVASYVLASLDIFQTYTLRVYYVKNT
jgi:TctA family transporter